MPAILEEGAAHGLGAALLYNEAFGKPGSDEDRAASERVRRLSARPHGVRIAGPNSLGALSLARGGTFYPMRSMASLPAGNVGIISASGGALQHWMLHGAARGLGYSYAISTGNEIDLGLADYIDFLAGDDATHVICVIAEGVREPQAFARAAARRARRAETDRDPQSRAQCRGAARGDRPHRCAGRRRCGIRCRLRTLRDVPRPIARRSSGSRAGLQPRPDPRAATGLRCSAIRAASKAASSTPPTSRGCRLAPLTAETVQRLSAHGGFPVDNPLDGGMRLALRADEYGAVCRELAADPNVDIIALQGRLPSAEAHSPHKLAAYNDLFGAIGKPLVAFERMAYNVDRATAAGSAMPFLQGIPETARVLGALVRYGARVRGARANRRQSRAPRRRPNRHAKAADRAPFAARRTRAQRRRRFRPSNVVRDRSRSGRGGRAPMRSRWS